MIKGQFYWPDMNILQEVQTMPAILSRYTKASWTVLAIISTANTMGINPHRLCNRTSRRQLVQNYHDVYRPIQQNGSASTITQNGCMHSS